MKTADAPRAGWYPDPTDRHRLRWWDGLDWTEDQRLPPSEGSREALDLAAAALEAAAALDAGGLAAEAAARGRRETTEIVSGVRDVARSEIDRAADVFSQRADAAVRRIQPLITEYSSKVVRLVQWAGVIAALVLVAWFVSQFILQASLFEWIGDRIDNLTKD